MEVASNTMTPKMLIEELKSKLEGIALHMDDVPTEETAVRQLCHALQDVISDLECVRDQLNIRR